jgi:hypothetical protein
MVIRPHETETRMSKMIAGLLSLAFAAPALASHYADPIVRWRSIVGVITAQGVNNPVNDINSGTFAWSARNGWARVNLRTGAAAFAVDGLVINGTAFSGTPGPVTQVEGTLVCNAGKAAGEATLDTAPVALNARGDADFSGGIGVVPSPCDNPLFLIRIVNPAGALGAWIATGADRTITRGGHDRSEEEGY